MTAGSVQLDPHLIDHDVTCLNCGYNLRTMKLDGTCPECGTAVSVSTRSDRLADAPPRWLTRLGGGARRLRLGVILTLPLLYVGVVIATIGLFMLTSAQPQRNEPAKDRNLRMAARLLVLLGCAGLILISAMAVYAISSAQYKLFGQWQYFDVLFIGSHALYLLGLLGSWSYLATLAMRMGDDNLVQRCNQMRTRWIAGAAAIVLLGVVGNAGSWLYGSLNVYHWSFAPILAGGVAMILLWLWFITLRFAGHLRSALRTSA